MNININVKNKVKSILRKKLINDEEEIVSEKLVPSYTDDNVDDIINYISNRIVGQEDAIKTLLSNIFYNQILVDEITQNEEFDFTELESRKVSILLDGPTGTGKSAIINDIASKISIPVSVTNVTRFFESSYVNDTTNDILYDLLVKADGRLENAERGIVILDEIDKIANNSSFSIREVRKSVQEEIISLMDGEIIDVSIQSGDQVMAVPFDTSKLTFIMSGDFKKLKNRKVNDDCSTRTIGFNKDMDIDPDVVSIKNYIKSGTIPGLFEKIRVIAKTRNYDVEDYKNILLKSEISPLNSFIKTIKDFDYKNVRYDSKLVTKLANDAYDMGVGARGLQILVSEAQNKVLYDVMTQKYNKNESIILTDDLLEPSKSKVRVR